jgi:hypothetical protein
MRCTLLACLLISATAFAGVKIVWDRVQDGKPPHEIKMQCEGDSARFEGAGDRPMTALWDGQKKLLSILHVEDKTYMQLDPARIAAVRGGANSANLGKGASAPEEPLTFKDEGKKSKVGKWDCELYEVKRGETTVEMCITPWDKAPLKREDLACLKSVGEAMRNMGMRDADGTHEDLSKFPGLPVQVTRNGADGNKSSTTLKTAEKATVAADAFTLPADFTPAKGRHP